MSTFEFFTPDEEKPESDINWVKKDTMDSGVEDTEDKTMRLYKEKTMQVIEKIKELGLPKPGEQIRLITKRSFNAVAFLQHISKQEHIQEIHLAIYSVNYQAAKIINEMILSGRINKAHILISNLRNKAHREKEIVTKQMFVDNPNVRLFYASSHAKIMNIKTEHNWYSIEGSGNLSYNSRIEQYVIDNDKALYDFTKQWFNEIKIYLKDKKELEDTDNPKQL